MRLSYTMDVWCASNTYRNCLLSVTLYTTILFFSVKKKNFNYQTWSKLLNGLETIDINRIHSRWFYTISNLDDHFHDGAAEFHSSEYGPTIFALFQCMQRSNTCMCRFFFLSVPDFCGFSPSVRLHNNVCDFGSYAAAWVYLSVVSFHLIFCFVLFSLRCPSAKGKRRRKKSLSMSVE